MGLFGLVWTLFMTTGKTVNGIKNSIEDSHNKEKSLDGIMYYDHKGRRRLISNNHFCYDKFVRGYRRIIDVKTGKIVWDERDEIATNSLKKYKEDAIKNGRSTYRCDSHRDLMPYDYNGGEIYGHQYKDFKTGKIFVIRQLDMIGFYVDISNNRAVRYTDHEVKHLEEVDRLREEKRKTCKNEEIGMMIYPPRIEEFRKSHQGRDPIEEYNFMVKDNKFYDNLKCSDNISYFENCEEKYINKEDDKDGN